MGTLYCLKCKQSATCDTFQEADAIIDHAASSIQCSAAREYLRWDGESIVGTVELIPTQGKPVTVIATATTKKSKKK